MATVLQVAVLQMALRSGAVHYNALWEEQAAKGASQGREKFEKADVKTKDLRKTAAMRDVEKNDAREVLLSDRPEQVLRGRQGWNDAT